MSQVPRQADYFGDAKIQQLQLTVRADLNVRRLDVAVYDSRLPAVYVRDKRMQRFQLIGDLGRIADRPLRIENPFLAHHLGKRFSFEVLHRDKEAVLFFAKIEDL